MALRDSPAFIGRPSLRRRLSTLDTEGQAAVQAGLSDLDPKRFKRLYRNRATALMGDERRFAQLRDAGALQQRRDMQRQMERDFNFASPSSGRSLLREY